MRRLWLLLCMVTALDLASAQDAPIRDAWSDARNPIVKLFHGQRLDLWSFRPVTRPAIPGCSQIGWGRTEVDAFVLHTLEMNSLSPSAEADKRTLGRRLFFDLTGLPPTPEQWKEWMDDTSPDAFEKLADQLLASPAFGEHWARMWLDAVRYSDSNGFDWDEFRPQAWRFRDYVIRSLNTDKPFDRFIREQLSGDEMLDGPPRNVAEQDSLIATGYLRLGPWDNSSKLFNEQDKARAAMMADLTETTAAVFLGLTMSCCRCHDHKTEPLSQQDHYRLRACFAGVTFRDELPVDLASEQDRIRKHNEPLTTAVEKAEADKKATLEAVRRRLRSQGGQQDFPDNKVQEACTEAEKKVLASSDKSIRDAKDRLRTFTTALLMTDESAQAPDMHVLALGDPSQPKDKVEPGIPAIFDPNALPAARVAAKSSGRRTALSQWLASPENPLTARVTVNRVWQQLFGAGIVATPNDFGHSGAGPSHPELLDWLARNFIECGWSLKRLVRLLVISAAYRQTSYPAEESRRLGESKDAHNRLLWRATPKRLSAEMLRDALLSTSGRLQPSHGGPPIWPELPTEILQANPAFLDDNAEKTKGWYPSPPDRRHVRSIYLIQKRSVRLPFMETFDLPDNFTTCARRAVSTVAPQALTLMNSQFAQGAAEGLAARIRAQAGNDASGQIQLGYSLVLQRQPKDLEREIATELISHGGLEEWSRVLLNLNEFIYVD